MDISTKYMFHLDDLRKKSKIKVLDFCNSICTERQYRRYLSGDNLISQKNLSLFISVLNMSDNDFFNSYHIADKDEYLQVSEIYNLLNSNKLQLAEELLNDIKPNTFHSKLVKDFYAFNSIYLSQLLDRISTLQALDKYSLLIDYPNILSKKTFNFVEILSLNKITSLEATINKFQAAEKLFLIVMNQEFRYLSSNNRYILPTIYSQLARVFGIKNDLDKSLKVCQEGINYSLRTNDMHALPQLYYIQALGLYKKGDRKLFKNLLQKCLMTCIIKNDIPLYNTFKAMSLNDFGFTQDNLDIYAL